MRAWPDTPRSVPVGKSTNKVGEAGAPVVVVLTLE